MKVGIIGAGFIARTAHLPALKSIPSIQVAGIADKDNARAKKVAAKFQIPQWYTSYEDLLKDDSIELIDICTPPQVRLEVIRLAAEKGKHILVEKPLALSLKEAIEIYRVVREGGVKLNIVRNYRYFPSVLKVKERVSKGYLGNIVTMQGSALTPHPANSTRALWLYHYGGALYDFAPHLIDIMLWINDSPVEKVFAFGGDFTGGNMGFINYTQILLEFENRAIAVADVSWLTAILGMKFTMNIHGTGGHMLLDVRNDNFMEFHGMLTPLDELGNSLKKTMKLAKAVMTGSYFKGAAVFYKLLIMDFLGSIGKNGEPPIPVEQGVMVNAILEASKESIIQNKPIHIKELFSSIEHDENLLQ
jgi:predicted dehydrogenase